MELVEGRDVLRATEEAPWQLILDLLVQVCRALSYVHSRKLIHYDIKPANVVVDDHDHVKVLDFGLASAKTIGSRGQWGGTPAYMAPELTDPEAFVDHRADLYSLGIMAYHLLCRRLPFEGRSHSELFRMHRFQALEFSDSDRQAIPSWLPGGDRASVRQASGRSLPDGQRGHRRHQSAAVSCTSWRRSRRAKATSFRAAS